jgi:hypothetical protein
MKNILPNHCACLICAALAIIAPRSRAAEMLVESLDGPVTTNEIATFKAFMQAQPASGDNTGNYWVYGRGGADIEALGMVYEISGDTQILDQMIRFADAALACRNDPATGRVIWTGKRDLCWPNKRATDPDATYSGSENGDVIGHIACCAKLILRTPAIWTNTVPIGDPHGYGTTYRARALTYAHEMDRSIDTFILPNFVSASDADHYRWPQSDLYRALGPRARTGAGTPIPWNQQTMLSNGFLRLAECHAEMADDPARVARYYAIVRTNLAWFLSDLHSYNHGGHTVYDWGYVLGRRSEDIPHGGYDIWGLCRAFDSGRFEIPRTTMVNFANTLQCVIYDATNNVFNMRVDGANASAKPARQSIGATWIALAAFQPETGPDLYHVIAKANRTSAKTAPLDDSFILWMKHRRYQASSATPVSTPAK